MQVQKQEILEDKWKYITVKSVVGHLPKHEILKRTSAFTLEQNHTSVHDAVTQVVIPLTSNNTWPNIQQ